MSEATPSPRRARLAELRARLPEPLTSIDQRVALGARVRDVVTGAEGLAVARTDYLFASPRVGVSLEKLDGDTFPELQWLDEARLEVVGEPANGRPGFTP